MLQGRHANLGWTAITFDPYIAGMIVRRLYITGECGGARMTDTFTLAHLSDPHLPPLPAARLRDLAGKRALGYLNWTRNRHKYHRREVLDALVADMQAQRPDHIAVTGDLVNLALEAEFTPGAGLARKRRHAATGHRRSRQSRRLCPRHAASFRRHVRGISARRRRRGGRHAVSVRAPARAAGADRRLLGGADAAADGHRPARPRAARCARSPSGADCRPRRPSGCCWCIIPCTRIRG